MLTLKEVRSMVSENYKGRVLTRKQLQEKEIVVKEKIDKDTEVSVYENGLVLYQSGARYSVFPLRLNLLGTQDQPLSACLVPKLLERPAFPAASGEEPSFCLYFLPSSIWRNMRSRADLKFSSFSRASARERSVRSEDML